jgi:electron transport complex protein RnfG
MAEARPFVSLLLVTAIAAGSAAIVTASWDFSKDRIAANHRARLLASLSSVLDPALRGRDLDPVLIDALDPALLGSDEPVDVFVPVDGATPLAAIYASVAPDGYNAPIHLLVGISVATGEVTGVRAVEHRETPGLGDQVDVAKSDWILQFDGRSLSDPEVAGWALTMDDGQLDSITGATVTARAVVRAVHNTLRHFEGHREELLARAREASLARQREVAE